MKRNILIYLLFAAPLILPSFAMAELRLVEFKEGSYKQLVARYQDSSFLMVLWSVDCPPCIEELPMLGKFHKLHPDTNLVMVSTDGDNQITYIQQLMRKHGLEDIKQWIFSGDHVHALRYAIDPAWYGELPRSYFHHKQHRRQAKSGRLDEDELSAWVVLTSSRATGL